MRSATPLPSNGAAFSDLRGEGRALRVSWHADAGTVVLSIWRDRRCVASFRLPADEVPALLEVLRTGLDTGYDELRPAVGS
jgi:hypothetical protein